MAKQSRTPYMRQYRVEHTAIHINRNTRAELARLKSKYQAPNADAVIKKLIVKSDD